MINFRFHIVSLTAVLLALGVGLVLGTAFLDEAVVDALRSQLDGLDADLEEAQTHAAEVESELRAVQDEQDGLDLVLPDLVLPGTLTDQPVLVVAPQGIDQELVDRVLLGLEKSNASTLGVWRFTDRFQLDDDPELEDLAAALEISTDDVDRLQASVVGELADVLYGVTDAEQSADPDAAGLRAAQDEGEDQVPDELSDEPAEPTLLARLREVGFVEYEFPDDREDEVVVLPPGGVRVVVVSDPNSEVPGSTLFDMLESVASEGRVPVVAAVPMLLEEDSTEAEEAQESSLVELIRADDMLATRISTVDDLDRASGTLATVLALRDAMPGDPAIGSYGQGDDAEQQLPPPLESTS